MLGTGKVEAGKGILYQIRAKRLRLGFFVFVRTGPPYRSPACRCRLVLFLPFVSFSFFYFRSPDSSAACPIFYRLPFVFVLLPPCTHCFRNSSCCIVGTSSLLERSSDNSVARLGTEVGRLAFRGYEGRGYGVAGVA